MRFVGSALKLEPIQVTKDQETCGKTMPSEVLIVNPQNKGLKNAVIFLEEIEKGKKLEKKITKAGVIRVQCDAHVHMNTWIMAIEHPYFAVTDENGSFKLDNIPPGKYKVIAWHEPWKLKGKDKGGRLLYEPEEGMRLVQEVTVPAKGEAKVTFEFK